MRRSARYTIMFAAIVSVIGSIVVATTAVTLRPRQLENQLLEKQRQVLDVASLVEPGEKLSRQQITQRFDENVEQVVIDLANGQTLPDVDPTTFDQRREAQGESTSELAPPNAAKVMRLPDRALVYQVKDGGAVRAVILPIEGMGLWSTLYGYIALSGDLERIEGITFYEHGETAGLGGEVDNPRWKALWPGRKAFNENWEPEIEVIKGSAGPADTDPYRVDGLAGATITSRGVTNLLHFWLGDDGFGPYLENYRGGGGRS